MFCKSPTDHKKSVSNSNNVIACLWYFLIPPDHFQQQVTTNEEGTGCGAAICGIVGIDCGGPLDPPCPLLEKNGQNVWIFKPWSTSIASIPQNHRKWKALQGVCGAYQPQEGENDFKRNGTLKKKPTTTSVTSDNNFSFNFRESKMRLLLLPAWAGARLSRVGLHRTRNADNHWLPSLILARIYNLGTTSRFSCIQFLKCGQKL